MKQWKGIEIMLLEIKGIDLPDSSSINSNISQISGYVNNVQRRYNITFKIEGNQIIATLHPSFSGESITESQFLERLKSGYYNKQIVEMWRNNKEKPGE